MLSCMIQPPPIMLSLAHPQARPAKRLGKRQDEYITNLSKMRQATGEPRPKTYFEKMYSTLPVHVGKSQAHMCPDQRFQSAPVIKMINKNPGRVLAGFLSMPSPTP